MTTLTGPTAAKSSGSSLRLLLKAIVDLLLTHNKISLQDHHKVSYQENSVDKVSKIVLHSIVRRIF